VQDNKQYVENLRTTYTYQINPTAPT